MAGLTAFKTLVKEGITDILVGILKGKAVSETTNR
jgi:hypothetical protein